MNKAPPGQVRIIAGHLRGSKLPVAQKSGLRPTSDRVRETLFNWLQHQVPGKRVLDLFAGTGALGFEAASRGAGEVVMVERDPVLAESLRDSARRLKVDTVHVECADARLWLARPAQGRFDLVFVDPPFADGLWRQIAVGLMPWLADGALIYVESANHTGFEPPPDWILHRQGQTRESRHALYRLAPGLAGDGADTLGAGLPKAGIEQA